MDDLIFDDEKIIIPNEWRNVLELYELNDEKLPFKCIREYWSVGNYFVVTSVIIPHDSEGKILLNDVKIVGNFYEGKKLKNRNVTLSKKHWLPREWRFKE